MVIDTHVHVIAEEEQRYPFTHSRESRPWYLDARVSAEQLLGLMKGAGVDRAIFVQPRGAYGYDNAYHADSAARYPDRSVGVCALDPLGPDAPQQLSYWIEERGVQGLRLFADAEAAWLDDPHTYPLWERAGVLGIPVCIQFGGRPERLPKLRAMVARFPGVPVVLDHMAGLLGPRHSDIVLFLLQELLDLADLPNVFLKVSTVNLAPLSTLGEEGFDVFRRVLDRYGSQRLMWGSNYPVSQQGSYADMVDLGRSALPFLSDNDRRWLLADTALSLWPSLKGSAL